MNKKAMSQSGFTLIESIITITLLSLLLGLTYQSMSVFLDAANRSNSRFIQAERNIELRLKLRASIRSMMDYYVKEQGNPDKEHYFKYDTSSLQYISLSSLFFEEQREVVTKLTVENQEQLTRLVVLECPLTEVLPFTLSSDWQKSDACREKLFEFSEQRLEFDVQFYGEKTNSIGLNILNPTQAAFAPKNETDHLLPKSISLRFTGQYSKTTWAFRPKIENRQKYLEDYGEGFTI